MCRRIFFAALLILTAGLLFAHNAVRAEDAADSPAVVLAADSPAVPPHDELFSIEHPNGSFGVGTLECGRMMLLLRIQTLEEKIDRLENQLAERQESVEEVSKTDAPSRYITRKPTGGDEGILIVDNQTMYTRQLKINDVLYSVKPGQSKLWVPLKPVVTQLIDFEDAKTWPEEQWQWNGRNYQLTIRIL